MDGRSNDSSMIPKRFVEVWEFRSSHMARLVQVIGYYKVEYFIEPKDHG
jgi:hypothetical protein